MEKDCPEIHKLSNRFCFLIYVYLLNIEEPKQFIFQGYDTLQSLVPTCQQTDASSHKENIDYNCPYLTNLVAERIGAIPPQNNSKKLFFNLILFYSFMISSHVNLL